MSAVFPLQESYRFEIYTASNGQKDFAIPFPFQANEDVSVYYESGTSWIGISPTAYAMTGAGEADGGMVSLTTGRTAGDKILVQGEAQLSRVTSIVRSGKFSSAAIDEDIDRRVIVEQEIGREISRTVRVAPGLGAGFTITEALQPGDLLMLDPDGNIGAGPNGINIPLAEQYAEDAMAYRDQAQGYKNDANTAAAAAAASAAALPPIAANRMLVDNSAGTQRQSKTFAEVRALLDVYTKSEVAALAGSSAVTMEEFSATGDGVADDTTAWNAAMASTKAHTLFLEKDYKLSSSRAAVAANFQRIVGPGRLIQAAEGFNLLDASGRNDLSIDGITLKGATASSGIASGLSGNSGIYALSTDRLRIRNVTITNFRYSPVYLVDCDDARLTDNSFRLNAFCARFRGCDDGIYHRNRTDGTLLVGSQFTTGPAWDSTDGHSYGTCDNWNIADNLIKNIFNAQGMLIHAGNNNILKGNTIIGAATPISLNPFNATDYCNYNVVEGNICEAFAGTWTYGSIGNDAIVLQGSASIPVMVGNKIVNNICRNGNRSKLDNNAGGIRVGYTQGTIVADNYLEASGGNGIVFTAGEDYAQCKGNVIYTVLAGSGGQQNGVLLSATGTNWGGLVDGLVVRTASVGIKRNGASSVSVGDYYFSGVTTAVA